MEQRQAPPRAPGNVPSAPACKGETLGGNGPSQFPLGSECWSVGANSQQREQDGAVLAQSSAGRRQGLAEQRCPGTGISTPLPILAVAGWAASLVHGEGPPVPGRMGQANCCCGSREALSDAEAVLSTDVRLTRGRKRSERRLLLLEEELVIAKLQHGGTTPRPQLCLALDQLWVVSGGKEAAGEEEEQEEEGSNEDRTSIILIWPTGSYNQQEQTRCGDQKRRRQSVGSRWREVVLPLCCVLLWAPQCEADMAIVERTPSPGPPQGPSQFPLGSECWSVGANSQQREQDGAVLAQSSAGRRQGLAEQRCPGTGISTPLPILAVAGWAASLVHGEGPPVPGRMGQANCCCGSREALSDAEAVLSTDVRLTRGRKRSERRLLLLEEELVIAKLQHGGTTPRPQLCLALDQLWVVSGGKEAAGEEEEQEEEGSNEDRTSIILIWPTSSYNQQEQTRCGDQKRRRL
ncbi:uncharacterized protein M6G45_015701 [Spheniscus humboldti]